MTVEEKFLREQRLQWIEHMKRMDDEKASVKAKIFVVDESKEDRSKKEMKKGYRKKHTSQKVERSDP